MPGCPICSHPERAAIEEKIRRGVFWVRLAAEYGHRAYLFAAHRLHHMPRQPQTPDAAQDPEPRNEMGRTIFEEQWVALANLLRSVLAPFPEAWDAVLAACETIDFLPDAAPSPVG